METPTTGLLLETCELAGHDLPKAILSVLERSDALLEALRCARKAPPLLHQGIVGNAARFKGLGAVESGPSPIHIFMARAADYRSARNVARPAEHGGLT